MSDIHSSIVNAMCKCGAVAKDSKNPQQGYKYRGIDAVMNAINPALRDAGIFVVPEVVETSREERTNAKGTLLIWSMVKVNYKFYAQDGSYISSTVIGEGMDSGDKSFNKAMSAAFKYALFQVFCIPTEEMVDSEVDSPEPQPKAKVIENPTAKDVQKLAKEVSENVSAPEKKEEKLATAQQMVNIQNMCKAKNVLMSQVLERYKLKHLSEMTFDQATNCIKGLMATKDAS